MEGVSNLLGLGSFDITISDPFAIAMHTLFIVFAGGLSSIVCHGVIIQNPLQIDSNHTSNDSKTEIKVGSVPILVDWL